MSARPFLLVDAFTGAPLGGNPCAVVLDADGLDDARRQALAREFNQAETAFVSRGADGADFSVQLFHARRGDPARGASDDRDRRRAPPRRARAGRPA
ncbi:MAG TPA: PhzF family phenazine biosynthesis protein, partial [Burkholderiaceae bacterium]